MVSEAHVRGNQEEPLARPSSCGDLTCGDVAKVRQTRRSVQSYVPESEVSLHQKLKVKFLVPQYFFQVKIATGTFHSH